LKKTISIITVVKDSEKLIEDTILSVINQTAFLNNNLNLEYLIHDGNSTDRTLEIIKKFSKNPNIIISSHKDNSLYESLSFLMKKTTGDYIAYINAGDIYHANAFDIINEIFKDKNINWLTGAKFFYNEKNQIIDFSFSYKFRNRLIKKCVYGKFLPFIQQESTFWRKEITKNIDFKYLSKLKYSGDMYIWKCFSKNNKLFTVNSFLGGFKYHDNQLTYKETGNTSLYLKEAKEFTEKINVFDAVIILIDSIFWFFLKNQLNISKIFNPTSLSFDNNKSWLLNNKSSVKHYSAWACEISDNQGEGVLGKKFINFLLDQGFEIKLTKPFTSTNIFNKNIFRKNIIIDKKYKKNFFENYVYPFFGIIFLWKDFLSGKKTIYVNYLPLWNFLIFLLLPPGSILGPITGGKYNGTVNSLSGFLRKYVLPFFNSLSLIILKFRYQKLLFSTEIYKIESEYWLNKKNKYYNFFTYNNSKQNSNNLIEKEIDFLIYFREHPNKGNNFIKNILEKLKDNFIIKIVGNNPFIDRVEYLGVLNKNELFNYLNKTRFTILSSENTNSLFCLDCIKSNISIFHNKNLPFSSELFEKNPTNVYGIDYNDEEESLKKIYSITKIEKHNTKKFFLKQNDFNNYLLL